MKVRKKLTKINRNNYLQKQMQKKQQQLALKN